jgi:hypothetical protein
MKALLTAALLTLTLPAVYAQAGELITGTYSPDLAEAAKLPKSKAVILSPISVHKTHRLRFTLTAFNEPAVNPQRAFRYYKLLIYGTKQVDGKNPLLAQHVFVNTEGSGPIHEAQMIAQDVIPEDVFDDNGRTGIIAILVGLTQQPSGPRPPTPAIIPAKLGFAAEISDGGTGIALLLPAVQKVREAGAR